MKVCRDCGAEWVPVRRGECSRCGSDASPRSPLEVLVLADLPPRERRHCNRGHLLDDHDAHVWPQDIAEHPLDEEAPRGAATSYPLGFQAPEPAPFEYDALERPNY